MSDFGTMIIARRRDGKSMAEQDRARLEEAIKVVRTRAQHQDATSELFRFRYGESRRLEGGCDLAIVLSEYWLEGIDDGFYEGRTVEELLEHDRAGAEAVRQALAAALGPDYDVELICDNW